MNPSLTDPATSLKPGQGQLISEVREETAGLLVHLVVQQVNEGGCSLREGQRLRDKIIQHFYGF